MLNHYFFGPKYFSLRILITFAMSLPPKRFQEPGFRPKICLMKFINSWINCPLRFKNFYPLAPVASATLDFMSCPDLWMVYQKKKKKTLDFLSIPNILIPTSQIVRIRDFEPFVISTLKKISASSLSFKSFFSHLRSSSSLFKMS